MLPRKTRVSESEGLMAQTRTFPRQTWRIRNKLAEAASQEEPVEGSTRGETYRAGQLQ